MRSLSKPAKNKQPPQNSKNNQLNDKKGLKNQSKKTIKTIFNSPFRYKIQTLSQQDSFQVNNILLNYIKTIRSELGIIPVKKIENQKIIRFNSKVKQEKAPLVCNLLIFGIKNCLKKIQQNRETIQSIVLFYQQSQHDLFEQLMCQIIYNKISYLILRDCQSLKEELGIKKLLCLGLTQENLSNHLLKFGSRCLIQIPWLVEVNWIPLKNQN